MKGDSDGDSPPKDNIFYYDFDGDLDVSSSSRDIIGSLAQDALVEEIKGFTLQIVLILCLRRVNMFKHNCLP